MAAAAAAARPPRRAPCRPTSCSASSWAAPCWSAWASSSTCRGRSATLDTKIAAAEERQRQLQEIKRQVDALELKRATFQRKVDLIERLKAEQSGPVHMLDEVSKALPDFVWLTNLDQTGTAIRFTGQSNGLTSIADFISALERSGWFPNVDLASSTEASNIITYALTALFKNPEVAKKEAEAAARRPIPGSTAAGPPPAAR